MIRFKDQLRSKQKKLNEILEKLEERGLITVEEKKGWLGKKIELKVTEKGSNELDQRLHEVKEKWNQMQALYQSGDKKKLKGSWMITDHFSQ